MRDATVTAFALQQGLHERWALALWAGLSVGVGCAGLARHAALAADADGLLLCGLWAGLLGGCCAMVLAWRTRPAKLWHLEWQGPACRLTPVGDPDAAREGTVQSMLDLGGWMLLRFCPADTGRPHCWLAASARRMGPGWHALRAALFRPDSANAAARRG